MTSERFYEAPAAGTRRSAPAALRNREPIAGVLEEWLPPTGLVLEIASGSGEHVVHFADRFPALEWQPSDVHPDALASILAWRNEAGEPNIREPIAIDAASSDWPLDRADAVLSINMVHISPWASALGLLDGAARLLSAGRAADPLRTVASSTIFRQRRATSRSTRTSSGAIRNGACAGSRTSLPQPKTAD